MRCGYVRGRTGVASVTIPPLQAALILPQEARNAGALAIISGSTGNVWNTSVEGYGSPRYAYNWTTRNHDKDLKAPLSGAAADSQAAWEGVAPQTIFENSDVVDATYYTSLGTPTQKPLRCQGLAKRTSIEFATTYQGQARVSLLSPGDCPGHMGRKQGYVGLEETITHGSLAVSEESGKIFKMFQDQASETVEACALRVGSHHVVPGNTTCCFHVDGMPDYYWRNWGVVNPATAADGSTVSAQYGFYPRYNIPNMCNWGAIVISNQSTSDSLTVNFWSKAAWAVQLQADDDGSALSSLATMARMEAEIIAPHMPPNSDPRAFYPTIVGHDQSELIKLHTSAIGNLGQHSGERPHSTGTVAKVAPTTGQTIFDGVKRFAHGLTNVASSAFSGIRSVIQNLGGISRAFPMASALMSRLPGVPGAIGKAGVAASAFLGLTGGGAQPPARRITGRRVSSRVEELD